MHNSEIPAAVLERVAAYRGEDQQILVDPARTAHLVVDLQIGFLAEGAIAEVPVARQIVPRVNRLCAAVREAGARNVFIRFLVDLDEPRYWGSMYDRMTSAQRDAFVDAFARGADQFALWPELDVRPEDWIADKTRFSAFIPGTCDLHERLQAAGVDTLIVTGTLSNCCCESTVRDAMQLGYKVLFVEDANATLDDEQHNATLANMAGLFFADVCTSDTAISRLGAGRAAVSGAAA
ncbi:cysteine hydrolase family protein [Phenylobacterium sp.]|uniref:cysteine hydrolase family protein n=1 Tax=Phenylobacterium sp. TaxID=1871053 RepID=UPI0035AF387D